jgi:hypothetical protein
MSKVANQVEFTLALTEFDEYSLEKYSYAFTAGYYNSLVSAIFKELPISKQKLFLSQITRSVADLQQE